MRWLTVLLALLLPALAAAQPSQPPAKVHPAAPYAALTLTQQGLADPDINANGTVSTALAQDIDTSTGLLASSSCTGAQATTGNVGCILDKSGNGNNCSQATSGSQGTVGALQNGLPTLNMPAAGSAYYTCPYTGEPFTVITVYNLNGPEVGPHYYDLLTAASTLGTYAAYYVNPYANPNANGSITGAPRQRRIWARTTTAEPNFGGIPDQQWTWSKNSNAVFGTVMVDAYVEGPQTLMSYEWGSADGYPAQKSFVSGSNFPANSTITTPQVLGAGWENGAADNFWSGQIMEVRVYNSALTPAQIRARTNYLESKWGVQIAQLDSTQFVMYAFQGATENACSSGCLSPNTELVKLGCDTLTTCLPLPVYFQPIPSEIMRDPRMIDYQGVCLLFYTNAITSVWSYAYSAGDCFHATQFTYVGQVSTSPQVAPNTWAPNPYIDAFGLLHVMVYLSSVSPGTQFEQHPTGNIFNPTSWSQPLEITGSINVSASASIDMFPLTVGGTTYAFFADQTSNDCVDFATSTATVLGSWSVTQSGNWANWGCGFESPKVIYLGPSNSNATTGMLAILLDKRGTGEYVSTTSLGVTTTIWTTPTKVTAPYVPESAFFVGRGN